MGGKKEVTIGFKYYLGMHMVICHGPIDSLLEIQVAERLAWSGDVTSNQEIFVNSPDLFGGEKKEGGIVGNVDVLMGESTQTKNSYLIGQLGSVIPAFRDVVSVVLKRVYVVAMSSYPKPWAFLVKRIPARTWYPETAEINGAANGAHIIYETLTNPTWGMGYLPDTINDTSFRQVALTLFNEGFGLNFELTATDSIENFIYIVVKHINGMFYTDPVTGKFALKLMREDYVVDDLQVFNESNITTLEAFERPSYAEMVNEIVVNFRPQGTSSDDAVTVQNIAAINAQEGVISQAIAYPGIPTFELASRVALRDLRQKSTPLARVKIKVLRTAWNTKIGDCIRFSWAEHGISFMVLRVLGIRLGDITSGEIGLDCLEDVFSLPNATYMGEQVSGWVDPIVAPQDITQFKTFEAPYWTIRRSITTADEAELDNTSSFIMTAAGYPAYLAMSYEFWTKPAGSSYSLQDSESFCPHCTLSAAAEELTSTVSVSGFKGPIDTVLLGTYAYIDDEIIRIDEIDEIAGTLDIGRGCLDTLPAKHTLGSRIYFAENFSAVDPTEYIESEVIYSKLLSRTGASLLNINSASESSTTMAGRYARPYPPGNVRLNGDAYPAIVNGPMTVSWAHRDRTLQLAQIIDHTSGNIGPETGVTYNLSVYNATTNDLLFTQVGVATTSVLTGIPSGTYPIRVELESSRGGITSLNKYSFETTYIKLTDERALETGDIRITEDGNIRTTE